MPKQGLKWLEVQQHESVIRWKHSSDLAGCIRCTEVNLNTKKEKLEKNIYRINSERNRAGLGVIDVVKEASVK